MRVCVRLLTFAAFVVSSASAQGVSPTFPQRQVASVAANDSLNIGDLLDIRTVSVADPQNGFVRKARTLIQFGKPKRDENEGQPKG